MRDDRINAPTLWTVILRQGRASLGRLCAPAATYCWFGALTCALLLQASCAANCGLDRPEICEVTRLDHVALHVKSLEASAAFYTRVFGFGIVNKWSKVWMVGNDRTRLGLFLRPDAQAVGDPDQKILIEHFALLTDAAGFARAVSKLDALGIAHEEPEDTGIAHSVFFRDPDGHSVEITYYYQHIPSR